MPLAAHLEEWARKATWTIPEAACLVHEEAPGPLEIETAFTSTDDISGTYAWLLKEFKYHNLNSIGEVDGEPVFSPGTLMRRLKENKRHVSKNIWKAYNQAHKQKTNPFGAHPLNKMADKVFREAARLAWEKYPDLRAEELSNLLSYLPSHMHNIALPRWSPKTISHHISELNPNGPGRPRMTDEPKPVLDLAEIAAKISVN